MKLTKFSLLILETENGRLLHVKNKRKNEKFRTKHWKINSSDWSDFGFVGLWNCVLFWIQARQTRFRNDSNKYENRNPKNSTKVINNYMH
jgi:hypothetical protein